MLAVAVVVLSLVVVVLLLPRLGDVRRAEDEPRSTRSGESVSASPAGPAPVARIRPPRPQQQARTSPEVPAPPPPRTRPRPARGVAAGVVLPRAAIVIDDLGRNLSHFEQLVGLDLPLALAIIPGLPATQRTVSEASRLGIEMLLHQPMEPHAAGGGDPGAGALLTTMTAEALRAQVRANLDVVPGAVGVNNHMGSRFTEDAGGLDALMAELREHDLFWLDSRTTAATRGAERARAAGVPAIERDIFLDAEVNVDFIRGQVRKLIAVARVHGAAVGIGHPHPETIAVLREMRAELLGSGIELVPVSTLVRGKPATGPGTALAAAPAGKGRAAGKPATPGNTATP